MQKTIHSIAFSLLTSMLLVFASCDSCKPKADPGEVAARVAKGYYDMLISGNYNGFIEGTLLPDTIPSAYRQQLLENAKMFIASQKDEHKGIRSVEISSNTVDTARHLANVYLILNFGDGGHEKIVVPMKEHRDVWYMR